MATLTKTRQCPKKFIIRNKQKKNLRKLWLSGMNRPNVEKKWAQKAVKKSDKKLVAKKPTTNF